MFPNVSHKSLMFVKELDVVHCDVGSTGFLMALVALIIGKQWQWGQFLDKLVIQLVVMSYACPPQGVLEMF